MNLKILMKIVISRSRLIEIISILVFDKFTYIYMKKIIKIYLFIQFLFDTIVEIFIEKKKRYKHNFIYIEEIVSNMFDYI